MVSDHLGNLRFLDLLEQGFHLRFEDVISEFEEVQEQEQRGERDAQSRTGGLLTSSTNEPLPVYLLELAA